VIAACEQSPGSPFSETGPALRRLVDAGVDRKDLCRVARLVAFESVFGLLYNLSDPGINDNDVEMLHESLLGADPSGNEGRES
jgi:hypothetical protein